MSAVHAIRAGLLSLAVCVVACSDNSNTISENPPAKSPYDLVNAFPNLTFSRPVNIQNAGDGSDRVFVIDQTGKILVVPNDPSATTTSVFLDITGEVTYASGGEMGLLGLAFHPQYASNGYFFVYYVTTTTERIARLSRFNVSAGDPNAADPASEKVLLEISEREVNHNGGGLCFDGNGYLCVGVGDEGGAGDVYNNAQDRTTLQGSVLRIDVDQNAGTPPYYGIPPDNPFAGNSSGYREEIYTYGMRNPWRISYDAPTDRLWIADVGQAKWEEIDIATPGGNYGWDCREGKHAYVGPPDSPSPACATASGFIEPVWEYSHSEGQSITGGFVYRGTSMPALVGRYLYADYIAGKVWALEAGATPTSTLLLKDTTHYLSTFGEAENGEPFVAAYFSDGTPTSIYRIVKVTAP